MSAQRHLARLRARDSQPIFQRTLALLATCNAPPRALLAALRSWARWCGAQLIVLAALSADGALADVHAVGSSTHVDAHALVARCLPLVGPTIRSLKIEKLSGLALPLMNARGVGGVLVIGVHSPRTLHVTQRQRLRQLTAIASVALQLTALRQSHDGSAPHPARQQHRLNRREREIIDLLIAGQTMKETAVSLNLSPRTVETYLDRLKQRHRQQRLHALLAHLVKIGLA